MPKVDKKELGRKSRQAGGVFERKVRADMDNKGWIVTKWQNQVDLDNGKIIPAPHKFNFFTKSITPGQGFPDFVCFKKTEGSWEVMGVESKAPKYLDKDEKAKCQWLLKNKVFDKILVGYKNKSRRLEYYEVKIEDDNGKKGRK